MSLGPSCPQSLASLPLLLIPCSPPRPQVPWESSASLGFDCGKACWGMLGDTWNSCLTCHKHARNQHKTSAWLILCLNNVWRTGVLGMNRYIVWSCPFSTCYKCRNARLQPHRIDALFFGILETVYSLISTVMALLINKDEMSVCSFYPRTQRYPRQEGALSSSGHYSSFLR